MMSIRGSDGSWRSVSPSGPFASAAAGLPVSEEMVLKRRSLLWMKARDASRRRRDCFSTGDCCSKTVMLEA